MGTKETILKTPFEKKRQLNFLENEIGKAASCFLFKHFKLDDPIETGILATSNRFNIKLLYNPEMEFNKFRNVVNLKRINDIDRINKFFETVNQKLQEDGKFAGCVETKDLRKERILKKIPPVLNYAYYILDYIFKRIFPKLPVTKRIYFMLTRGRNRVITKAETFGRLYSCGFKIIADKQCSKLLYFVARKVGEPDYNMEPSYGLIFRMKRIGRDGKMIKVFKLRTMHP